MKRWLCSFVFLPVFCGFSQGEVEHVKLVADSTVETNYFPHIDRYYDGEIPIAYLGDSGGIQVTPNWKVISFSISYPYGNLNKIVPVKGNMIPDYIIRDIYANSMGEMIFITNIVAVNEQKKALYVVPMHLTPVK